jgi:membrane protein YqaA with SNARE-associated domain
MGFFSLLISGIFVVALIFLQRIKSEVFSLISVYGYLAIFIIAFLVDILVQPLGPEVPLITAKTLKLGITPTLFL